MAKYTELTNRSYLSKNKRWYYVEGEITRQDVEQINKLSGSVVLVLKNTKGQNSEVIKNIKGNNIEFSVVGGLNYFQKQKFRSQHYIERTLIEPRELSKIINFFEKVESKIRYSWTDSQKCMYVYKTLAEALHYNLDHEPEFVKGKDVVRSLNGLLFGRLVCSGFALVFKEAMDRIGIPCVYQNKRGSHSWNIVELDGKRRGVELTWDCSGKRQNKNKCGFYHYGRQDSIEFYTKNDGHHDISRDPEETMYDFEPFTMEELNADLSAISNNGLVREFVTESLIDVNGEKIYYILGERKKGVQEYFVSTGTDIMAMYSKDPPQIALNKRNIIKSKLSGNPCIGNITVPQEMNKTKVYTRDDGSTFIIKESSHKLNNMNEFYLIDVKNNGNGPLFRRGVILTELNLTSNYTNDIERKIASSLLSKERVARKMNRYQGYVGYLGRDGHRYYDEDFEKNSLNIHTRKF